MPDARRRDIMATSGFLTAILLRCSALPVPETLWTCIPIRKRFFGRGFYNPQSKIRVRLLTFQEEPIDDAFFAARLRAAAALRHMVASHTNACRLVHGESDLLPGLVVDRFADVAVMQALSYGMDVRKELLGELLVQECGVRSVYLRNDAKSRTLEGLPLSKGFLRGDSATTVNIHEGMPDSKWISPRGRKPDGSAISERIDWRRLLSPKGKQSWKPFAIPARSVYRLHWAGLSRSTGWM